MGTTMQAACGCHIGKIRKRNEDNFYFDGEYLPLNQAKSSRMFLFSGIMKDRDCAAVFDGMGGENFGDVAAYEAASSLQTVWSRRSWQFDWNEETLSDLIIQINDAVVDAKKRLATHRCGCTMAALVTCESRVYCCNIGDSRIYRLRRGAFLQLSVDHVEKLSAEQKMAPLTQYLGIDPEEMLIEPHIAADDLLEGDTYLLCSDGLSNMLTDVEMMNILQRNTQPKEAVKELIQAALERGGRDNITAVVCTI